MSINVASQTGTSNGRRDIPYPVTPVNIGNTVEPSAYVRPADWLTLPTFTDTESRFVGLLAVTNDDSNYVSFLVACSASSSYTVDWGDGSSNVYASGAIASKKYDYATISNSTISSRGYKQVIISVTSNTGLITTVNLQQKYIASQTLPNNVLVKWLDISIGSPFLTTLVVGNQVGTVKLGLLEQFSLIKMAADNNFSGLFAFCNALRSIPVFNTSNFTSGRDWNSMFIQCTSLTSIPTSIDFTWHQNFFSMFSGCTSLVDVPPLNTPNLNNSRLMFQGCVALTSISSFDVSKVTSAQRMFDGCAALQTVPTLNFSPLLTNTSAMFQGCTALISAPYINTINVTDFSGMFNNAQTITTVPAYNYVKANTVDSMFNQCTALKSVPTMVFGNTAVVLSYLFQNCYSLVEAPQLINTGLSTSTVNMFSGCQSLRRVPLFDTSSVVNTSSMFSNCFALTEVPLFNFSNVTTMTNTFTTCKTLKTIPVFNTFKVTNFTNTFGSCPMLQTIPLLNTSNATSIQAMFSGCLSLVDVPLLDTTKVTDMTSVFSSCTSLVSVPTFNTSNVTNLNNMFFNTTSLVETPAFTDTSKVINMSSMFSTTSSLRKINNFNTSNLTTVGSAFNTMGSLVSIPAFDVSKCTTLGTIFSGSTALADINITGYSASFSVTSTNLGKQAIEKVFNNMVGNATVRTVTITGCPGADTLVSKTASSTINSRTITMANTVGVTSGQFLSTSYMVPITVTARADNYLSSATIEILNDAMVSLATQPLTGGFPLYTPLYVINSSGGAPCTFQVSLTPGGSAYYGAPGVDATCTLRRSPKIIGVTANTSVTVDMAASSTTTNLSVGVRTLDIRIPTVKNWAITG